MPSTSRENAQLRTKLQEPVLSPVAVTLDCQEDIWILFVTISHFTIILNPWIPLSRAGAAGTEQGCCDLPPLGKALGGCGKDGGFWSPGSSEATGEPATCSHPALLMPWLFLVPQSLALPLQLCLQSRC